MAEHKAVTAHGKEKDVAIVTWLEIARQEAAQCWCDPETEDRVMDVALAEAVAKRIAAWMDTAARHCANEDFYRGLLDQTAAHLGPDVFKSDDGSIQDSPIRLKIPELVAQLAATA